MRLFQSHMLLSFFGRPHLSLSHYCIINMQSVQYCCWTWNVSGPNFSPQKVNSALCGLLRLTPLPAVILIWLFSNKTHIQVALISSHAAIPAKPAGHSAGFNTLALGICTQYAALAFLIYGPTLGMPTLFKCRIYELSCTDSFNHVNCLFCALT